MVIFQGYGLEMGWVASTYQFLDHGVRPDMNKTFSKAHRRGGRNGPPETSPRLLQHKAQNESNENISAAASALTAIDKLCFQILAISMNMMLDKFLP